MARQHGGDLYDFANLDDDEIRRIVLQQLREYPNLDAGWIEVDVRDGFVTLSGRVGTDAEVQVAEAVLDDVLGLEGYANDLVVDELHRIEQPEAADEAAAFEDEFAEQVGRPGSNQSDTAEHLVEDLEGEAFGTHDMGQAISEGLAYEPPDRPVSDGYRSTENH